MLQRLFLMFCYEWKTGKPKVVMKQTGTMVTVLQYWILGEILIPGEVSPVIQCLGGILLAMSLSRSKIILIFHHMELSVYTIWTLLCCTCTPEEVFVPSCCASVLRLTEPLSSASWSQQKLQFGMVTADFTQLDALQSMELTTPCFVKKLWKLILCLLLNTWNSFKKWVWDLLSYTIKDCYKGWVVCQWLNSVHTCTFPTCMYL